MADQDKRRYRRADETRKVVLDVAGKLFYEHGIRAIGIDRVAEEAGVTTTTLYRLFGSKDGLIAAYLEAADRDWFTWFEASGGARLDDIGRFFDELEVQAGRQDYRGCPFRMALAEYPSAGSEVHKVATNNKRRTRQRFLEMAAEAGMSEPGLVADQLMVLVDGICASATERTPDSPGGIATTLLRQIVATAG